MPAVLPLQFSTSVLRRVIACLLTLVVSWLGLGSPAIYAQELTGTAKAELSILERSTKGFSGLDASAIPSEKVNQFVHACLQVVALIERREGELQGAETESESRRIEQEIEAEAIAIIEQAGLTRQEYLQLLSLANVDPEFGERVAALLQEAPA